MIRRLLARLRHGPALDRPHPPPGTRREDADRPQPKLTTDPTDPRLTHGVDAAPVPQAAAYLVLSDEERAKGFVRPVRRRYVHLTCGAITTMSQILAETYARDPSFYGATFCTRCSMHKPVSEFEWDDDSGEKVGS